jgi:hypothetical protein
MPSLLGLPAADDILTSPLRNYGGDKEEEDERERERGEGREH